MRQERVLLALIVVAILVGAIYYLPAFKSENLEALTAQTVSQVDPCAAVQGVEVWSEFGALLVKELGANEQSTHMVEDQCVTRNNALWIHFTPKGDSTETCSFFDGKSIRMTQQEQILSISQCQDDPGSTGGFWSKVRVTAIEAPPPPPDVAVAVPQPPDDPTMVPVSSNNNDDGSSAIAGTWQFREQNEGYGEMIWSATATPVAGSSHTSIDAIKKSIAGEPATACEKETHLRFQLSRSMHRVPYTEVNCEGQLMTGYVQITDFAQDSQSFAGSFYSESGVRQGDFQAQQI
jgi:hypothetical protein